MGMSDSTYGTVSVYSKMCPFYSTTCNEVPHKVPAVSN